MANASIPSRRLYVAPATILSGEALTDEHGALLPSLQQEASSHGVCYFQVVRHLEHADLYQVQVAATPDLLAGNPFTAFLTPEQLVCALPWSERTACSPSQAWSHHIASRYTCVALADILSDESRSEDGSTQQSLRAQASAGGLCYLRAVRYLPHADLYQAQVAASVDVLTVSPCTIFLTEAQLRYTLPYDDRTQRKPASVVCTLLRAHAAAVQPIAPRPRRPLTVPLTPLPVSVEVAPEVVETVLVMAADEAVVKSTQVQQPLLSLALRFLSHISWQIKEHHAVCLCHLVARLRQWQRLTHQCVVEAVRQCDEQGRLISWQLQIGVPETVLLWGAA